MATFAAIIPPAACRGPETPVSQRGAKIATVTPWTLVRLEALLGAPLRGGLTEAHLRRLLEAGVAEDEGLELKREPWPQTEAGNAELAKDVAALANAAGGVIIVGVGDPGMTGAALSPFEGADEKLCLRVRSVVASAVHPMPELHVQPVASEERPGRGYLVVLPPSALAPHAVVRDHKLAYPVRYGARTVHLTESEVADRYRRRFAQARERAERLDEVIAEGQAVLDPDQAWLTVAVVPEVPGTVPIDYAALERLTLWARSLPQFPLGGTWHYELGNPGVAFRRVRLGPPPSRRPPFVGSLVELHADGAFFAARRPWEPPGATEGAVDPVGENSVVLLVAAALLLGCRFAAEQARVWGGALVAAQLLGRRQPAPRPLQLWHAAPSVGFSFFQPLPGGAELAATPAARRDVDIDAVSRAGPDWLVATRMVANDLLQAFGMPETAIIGPAGSVRPGQFEPGAQRERLQKWAKDAGVELE